MDINLAGEIPNSLANGPGLRYVVFVQGCPHHCEGCHNQHTWEFKDNYIDTVDNVFERILKNTPYLDGLTISGGEPFKQPKAVYELAKKVKENLGLSIVCYTGYTYEQLKQMSMYRDIDTTYRNKLLNIVDILIDGKFEVDNQEGHHRYAGSKNQRCLILENGDIKGEVD